VSQELVAFIILFAST